jgi:hypothetical protein
MATRFYLPTTGTPAISPAVNGTSWPQSSLNFARITMVTARIGSAMATIAGTEDAATGNQIIRQFISASLSAQTISGTIKGAMRCLAVPSGSPGTLAVRVAKCASDGTGVTEIMAVQTSSDVTVPPVPPTSGLTNRRLEQGSNDFTLELTNTGVNAGDFLIVELGYNDITTNTSRHFDISFGDDSVTDLPEDETTTTADNPWVEFSMDIGFGGGPVGTSRRWTARPMLMGLS